MTSRILMALAVVASLGLSMAAPTAFPATEVPVINMTAYAPVIPDTQATRPRVTGSAVTTAVADLIAHSCVFDQDNLFLRRVAASETNDGLNPRTFSDPNYHGGIWRVDNSMFRATQANTYELQLKYDQIRRAFGINWLSVRWDDLQKPLYSALAAALYISTQGKVPLSTEEQGNYLHNHYQTTSTAHNYTRAVARINDACDGTEHADVVFLLDVTISANDFTRMIQYVRSVVQGFNIGPDHVQVAMYEFGGGSVVNNFGFNSYATKNQVLSAISTATQLHLVGTPFTGRALKTVLRDWRAARPNAAKIVVIVTDSPSNSRAELQSAGAEALQEGVSVFTIGVGSSHNHAELLDVSTNPDCAHHFMVSDFRQLKDIVELTQHAICIEPMIARGMVSCRLNECRNVAFPMTSNTMTLIANVTCDDGNVYVTTRMPSPGPGFTDFKGYVRAGEEPTYVAVSDDLMQFIYAEFIGSRPDPNCIATISTVNGLIDIGQKCTEWQYPLYNPCEDPNRGKRDKFPYGPNDGMFIQCDLRNKMYLTRCPPGEPFFHPTCMYCVGTDSPALGECGNPEVPTGVSPYCGLPGNPCTSDNIAAGKYYFACPGDETKYLQCNTWGHAFVRSCQPNFVWREVALTCEYQRPGLQNPCQPGDNFYPYPQDPHYYIQCNDLVPNLMPCNLDFVWDDADSTCVPPTWSAGTVTQVTRIVTLPPYTTHPPSGGGGTIGPNGLIYSGWSAPCTRAAVSAMDLYHEYPGHPQEYIQCDLWGDSFVRHCQANMYFNPASDTCVDGAVVHNAPIGRK